MPATPQKLNLPPDRRIARFTFDRRDGTCRYLWHVTRPRGLLLRRRTQRFAHCSAFGHSASPDPKCTHPRVNFLLFRQREDLFWVQCKVNNRFVGLSADNPPKSYASRLAVPARHGGICRGRAVLAALHLWRSEAVSALCGSASARPSGRRAASRPS